MAPEQMSGQKELKPTVDVYAIGCMAYELLTGKPPFEGDLSGALRMAGAPTPLAELMPDLPKPLGEIVEKCLRRKPGERYPDGKSLYCALADAHKDMQVAGHPGSDGIEVCPSSATLVGPAVQGSH
jgi:serine/threonine protein kinase